VARPRPNISVLTEPLWSHPLATDPASREATRREPNTPAAAKPVKSAILPDPNVTRTQDPNVRVTREPNTVAAGEPNTVIVREPNLAAPGEPNVAAATNPNTAAAGNPTAVVAQEPNTVAAREPNAVIVRESNTAAAREPNVAAAMNPNTAPPRNPTAAVTRESNAAAAREPNAVVVRELAAVAPREPNVAAARNPNTGTQEPNVAGVRNPTVAMAREPNTVVTQPLSPATWMSVYNRAAEKGLQDIRAERLTRANRSWTVTGDLEKYRAYAVKDGARESGDNLRKAMERADLALDDGANVLTLGYASDRGEPFRINDGKSVIDEPGNVPQRAGETLVSFGTGLYSLADVVTLNALPDPDQPAYKDNVPIVRPILFAGRTVGGIWKTTEEVGNAVTWGYFDNVTGCVGLLLVDLIEVLKHAGEAVTNVARLPMRAIGVKDEGGEKAMDWVLLVPLEFAANSVEMKGIGNTIDYKTAFADKGVIGSIVEFGGSGYVLYRVIDEATEDHHDKHRSKSSNGNNGGTPPDNPGMTPEGGVTWIGYEWSWWPPD
jgi:hypothetical protein